MNDHGRILALAGALLTFAGTIAPLAAGATTATGSLSVTATVTDSCSVTTGTVAFGTWDYTAGSTASGSISVTCTTGTAVSSITLDNGANFASSTRNMKDGASHAIAYALYSDSGFTAAWGSGANFPAAATYTATSSAAVFSVYGKAPAAATVPAGSYSDSVGVTVTYT